MPRLVRSSRARRTMVRPRRGFTLVELLIVSVIIGVIALVSFSGSDRAISTTVEQTMQRDLRRMVNGANVYFVRNGQSYVGISTSAIGEAPSPSLTWSYGNVSAGSVRLQVHHPGTGRRCSRTLGTSETAIICENGSWP